MREMKLRKQWLKKGIAMIIALAMVAGMLPVVNLQEVFAEGEYTVTTAPLALTGVAKTDCTTKNNNDGTITGVTEAMEYRKISGKTIDWTSCPNGDITGLIPGNYEVRKKQTETAMDSEVVSITINALPTEVQLQNPMVFGEKKLYDPVTLTGDFRANGSDGAIWAKNGAQVTLQGNGSVHGTLGSDNFSMAVWAKGSGTKVVINGGTYTNETDGSERGTDLIYASGGATIEINGGTFQAAKTKWTLNCKDGSSSKIIVKGGRYYDFNPSNPGEHILTGEVEVPDTHKVIQDGEWYCVVPKATGITLNKKSASIEVGKTVSLNATVAPEGVVDPVVWSTSDANVATVENGVVTAVGKGVATITATIDGKNESCEVSVYELVCEVGIADLADPVAGQVLDTNAVCDTTGVKDATVEWKVEGKTEAVTGDADFGKVYTANIKLSAASNYQFDSIGTDKATVNGKVATAVSKNEDGTLTVSYTFPATAQYIPPYIPPVATSTPEPTPTPTPSPEPTETPAPSASASAEPSMEPISEEVTTSVGKEVETVVEEIVKGTDTTVVDETTATKIKEAVEQGKDIETEIVAEPVSEEKVDATEAKAIEETVKSLENTTNTTKTVTNVAQFINIEILIKAGGETLGNLTALKEPIKLKIAIPENLKADSRKFFVVRLHNGKVEKLDSVMNEDGTLTFSTDKFSTYALAYEDTVEVEKTVGKTKIGSTSRTTSSVTLPWSKVAGATKYRVYYKVNGAAKYTMVADTTSLKYTVKGLKSATTYKFAVKAFGYGKWSDVYATKITTTSPDKVSTVTATPGSRKATVKYSKVARATGYEIYMAKGNGKYVKVKTTKSNSYVKTGLSKGATYKFKVRAFKKVGTNVYYGAFSSAKYAKVK